jgi:cytochrome c
MVRGALRRVQLKNAKLVFLYYIYSPTSYWTPTVRAMSILAMLFATLAACGDKPPQRVVAGGDAVLGKRLVEQYQCGACHLIPGARAAAGTAGPPLSHFGRRSYIAGQFPNDDAHLMAWLVDPPSMKPGTLMPAQGVSPLEARHMAAYLVSVQ